MKKQWYQKPLTWIVIFIIFILIAMIPFIINDAYLKGLELDQPNTSFDASDMLSLYGAFITFIGTIVLGALALWQNIKANDISNRLLAIEEQNNTPYLEILRDSSCISKKENVLRFGVCVHNISKMPLHNIKLVTDGVDFDFEKDYNEANFHKWMIDIARNFNYHNCKTVGGSCVHFVASMSESLTRTRRSTENGVTSEKTTAEYSDLAHFYFDCNIERDFDHAIQIKFIMENINRVKYIQTSELYVYINNDDKYSIINHSTTVQLYNKRDG